MTDELRTILERELSHYFRASHKIIQLLRRPSEYRTSFAIEELIVDFDDGKHLELIFKNLSWEALSHNVRQVKPRFLHNPLRKIEVYRTILASAQIGTATCYGASVDEQRQRYWLFWEQVHGQELYQSGEIEAWQAVARWLAEFHGRFIAHSDRLMQINSLLHYNGVFYRRWMQRACSFAKRNESKTKYQSGAGMALAAKYEKVVERLIALALAYYKAQKAPSYELVNKNDFLTALDYCRLHIAVQWLGWAPKWSPPAENAHDWLGEALRVAEKLAL